MDFKKTKFGRYMNCRVPANKRYQPTEYEHAANCATHAIWILPSMVGGSVLYFLSVDKWHRVAALLYGSGLTGLFLTSTLFHTAAWKINHLRKVEERFHKCDRMAIYFFIAASYSPWLMLRELGPWTYHMRWLIWVMACVGSTYVFFFHERYKLGELLGYVTMGAVPALVILSMVSTETTVWLLSVFSFMLSPSLIVRHFLPLWLNRTAPIESQAETYLLQRVSSEHIISLLC